MIAIARTKEFLDYNPRTGEFTYTAANPRWCGFKAGTLWDNGYIRVRVRGKYFYAHRLAWFFVHGTLPNKIDHRNRNRADNRIDNLRECSDAQSRRNVGKCISRRTTSKYKGVYWCKQKNKWHSRIGANYTHRHLGFYDNEEAAARAYDAAAVLRDSEFVALNFTR